MCTLFSLTISAQRKSTAQIDTMACNVSCITKFVSKTNDNGKVHVYAVYKDDKHDINELIPVSKSVFEYIQLCQEYGLTPSLGIRLRNGQISGLIRYKQRFVRK